MLLAAHLLAPRLAQRAPFLWSSPVHDPEDTPWGHVAQVIVLPDDESVSTPPQSDTLSEGKWRPQSGSLPDLIISEKIFKKVLDIAHCMLYSVYSTVFEVHHDHHRKPLREPSHGTAARLPDFGSFGATS